jgi:hypothetical protein
LKQWVGAQLDTAAVSWLHWRQHSGAEDGLAVIRRTVTEAEIQRYFNRHSVDLVADMAAGMLADAGGSSVMLEIVPGVQYGRRPIRAFFEWGVADSPTAAEPAWSARLDEMLSVMGCGHLQRYEVQSSDGNYCALCELDRQRTFLK